MYKKTEKATREKKKIRATGIHPPAVETFCFLVFPLSSQRQDSVLSLFFFLSDTLSNGTRTELQ